MTGEKNKKIIITCKGFSESGKILYSQLVNQDSLNQYFVFSGPTFSVELSKKLPSAIVLASKIKKEDLENLSIKLSLSYLRVYSSSDPIGVSLGGILKNIIAIAAGISDGLGFGLNARSALITRGPVKPESLKAFFDAVSTIDSDFEKGKVLKDFLMYFRDEMTKEQQIALFQLIELFDCI